MKIEFVIPTYNRTNHLMTIINSIFSQTSDKWFIHVVADCPPEGTLDKIMEYFKGQEDKIKFTILPQRYNDWGHTPRNYGLENAKEEWVVMTGEDNYYAPTFVEEFLSVVKHNVNFVFCNMVHNWVKNDYICITCQPKLFHIDIGCFMTRTKYSSKMKLDVKQEWADGYFVEEYLKKTTGFPIHINKFLYVHN